MEKTTLYLPADLLEDVKQTARREGRSQADVIRSALEQYVQRFERPRPRSIGLLEDASLDGVRVRDWVRESWRDSLDHA